MIWLFDNNLIAKQLDIFILQSFSAITWGFNDLIACEQSNDTII